MLKCNLLSNLKSGAKLCLLQRVAVDDFRFSLDQAAALLALDFVLVVLRDFLLHLPAGQFEIQAFPAYGAGLICFFLAVYLLGKILNKANAALKLTVIVYSSAPLFVFLQLILGLIEKGVLAELSAIYFGLGYLYFCLLVVVLMRSVTLLTLPMVRFAIIGLAIFSLVWVVPGIYFGETHEFWSDSSPVDREQKDLYAEYRTFDAERLMYQQAEILNKNLKSLVPGKLGSPDLYFVSFAGYAYQDVFSKETSYANRLFDQRFGTASRSIRLVNHLKTRESIPLASATNLAITLKHIGKIMDLEEDMLVLYLTSHGSKTHKLSVNFWPLPLNDLTPELLRNVLDASGIKWRVIIISACYSGGFVETIKGPYSMIATASAADRTSFGCSNENEFTYYGEAVFKDQLPYGHSFIEAFRRAMVAIEVREQQEDLPASRPQLFVGSEIEKRLKTLVAQRCANERSESVLC